MTHIVVENDEDVELVLPDKRIYAQIKTRGSHLILGDIDGALSRFHAIRTEHAEGRRSGTAEFAIISNSAPGPELSERLRSETWPSDNYSTYERLLKLTGGLPLYTQNALKIRMETSVGSARLSRNGRTSCRLPRS